MTLRGEARRVPAEAVREGDTILFLGEPHVVEWIEPRRDDVLGDYRLAFAAGGWCISLIPGQLLPLAGSPEPAGNPVRSPRTPAQLPMAVPPVSGRPARPEPVS